MTRVPVAAALVAIAAARARLVTGCIHPYAPQVCSRPDFTGCVVAKVAVSGDHEVGESDITAKIATAETNHPLGILQNLPILSLWDRLTVAYEKLDPFVLERDLARVERIYKARGYYEAHARAGRVLRASKGSVRVEIVVEEGEPVRVAGVQPEWVGVPPSVEVQALVQHALREDKHGKPFDEDVFEATKGHLRKVLTDSGYAYAHVHGTAQVDLIKHAADLTYSIDAGPLCTFGPIDLTGEGDLPKDKLLQAVHIKAGDRFSSARLESAQAALSDLRVVGSVEAKPQLSGLSALEAPTALLLAGASLLVPPLAAAVPAALPVTDLRESVIPIVFQVTSTTLKTTKVGLGAEVGSIVEAHGVIGWENRNFLGGLRHFTVEAKPGVVVNPLTLSALGSTPLSSIRALPEARVHAELAQPGFIEARSRGLLSVAVNLYQLLPTEPLGYFELAGKTGLERDFWGTRVHVGAFANMVYDKPVPLDTFSTANLGACGYNELLIPSGQALGVLDLRYDAEGKRDPLNPHSGFYLANDVQLAYDSAPGASSTKDLRIRPEVRGYIPMGKRVTLALRAAGGLLYTFGGDLSDTGNKTICQYGQTNAAGVYSGVYGACSGPLPTVVYPTQQKAESCQATGTLTAQQQNAVDHSRYVQILQLRGFTSGGPSSNRGYGYNGVGPQEVVQGVSPYVTLPTVSGTPPVALVPIATGGKAVWEASIELRFPLYDKLGATLFAEGSDVRREITDFAAPFAPHLSTGFGLRYLTPVGPLRADFGVRVPGAQVIGQNCPAYDPTTGVGGVPGTNGKLPCNPGTAVSDRYLAPQYGQAGSVFGLPMAVSLAIGEAF